MIMSQPTSNITIDQRDWPIFRLLVAQNVGPGLAQQQGALRVENDVFLSLLNASGVRYTVFSPSSGGASYKVTPGYGRRTTLMQNNDDSQCCVCMEAFQPPCAVLRTDCGHMFHAECLDQWVKHKNSCPLCQSMIPLYSSSS